MARKPERPCRRTPGIAKRKQSLSAPKGRDAPWLNADLAAGLFLLFSRKKVLHFGTGSSIMGKVTK